MKIASLLSMVILLLTSCNKSRYQDITITDSQTAYILQISEQLSALGTRNAGTEEEGCAANLIESELTKMKIKPVREKFNFRTFEIDSIQLKIGDSEYTPEFTGINPFDGPEVISAPLITVMAGGSPSSSPDGKIMISDEPNLFFMALQSGSKAFVSLTRDDFDSIKSVKAGSGEIRVAGKAMNRSTANIIADIGRNSSSEGSVYLTAHYDSYLDSPGANDNGTGTGALLAMAELLKSCEESLPVNFKLIFLGAEEIGLVGSREYVITHLDELEDCRLLINFDTFGGNEAPYIATARGLQGVPEDGIKNQADDVLLNRALEGPFGKWRLFDPALFPLVMASNYPKWVQGIVDSIAVEMDMVIYNQHLMSDHLVFAGAGVPSISIQSREHTIHSPEDTPGNINRESVASCFMLSWEIIKRIIG